MMVGIIGAGALGTSVARMLARKNVPAVISNSRGADSLAKLVQDLGPSIKAGTVADAAAADLVLVAVPWINLDDVLGRLPAWNSRIVIDGTNPVLFLDPASPEAKDQTNPLAAYGIKAIDLGDRTSSSVFSEKVPGARVVKAFNHLDTRVYPDLYASPGKRAFFYAGDDAEAKAEVGQLLRDLEVAAIDLGGLEAGGALFQLPFGPLAGINLIQV